MADAEHRLDITKHRCPMTFVHTRLALERLEPGGVLEVLLTEGEPLQNVPRTAQEQGHAVLGTEPMEGGVWRVLIRKAAGTHAG